MKKSIIIIGLIFCNEVTRSQGCSDAGFCTLNGFSPSGGYIQTAAYPNQLRIGISGGGADNDISVFSALLEYNRQLNKSFNIDARLVFLSQSGNNISVGGFSDVYINMNYAISEKSKIILGAKIPLSDANKQKDGRTLPMDYQSSLGTFDLIIGFGFNAGKWKFNLGWQQPLSQNRNTFFAGDYPVNSVFYGFQSTNGYKRSGDALLRISYPFKLSKKLFITPGILPIYHLANDKFTTIDGRQVINGSKGVTLNANIYLNYEISKRNALELAIGSPLIVRDVRPEGLSRSFIATLQYELSF